MRHKYTEANYVNANDLYPEKKIKPKNTFLLDTYLLLLTFLHIIQQHANTSSKSISCLHFVLELQHVLPTISACHSSSQSCSNSGLLPNILHQFNIFSIPVHSCFILLIPSRLHQPSLARCSHAVLLVHLLGLNQHQQILYSC